MYVFGYSIVGPHGDAWNEDDVFMRGTYSTFPDACTSLSNHIMQFIREVIGTDDDEFIAWLVRASCWIEEVGMDFDCPGSEFVRQGWDYEFGKYLACEEGGFVWFVRKLDSSK